MNLEQIAQKVRARAAASPRIRKLAGKPPLVAAPPPAAPDETNNSSYWVIPDEAMWPVAEVYRSFEVPALGYGTVRDFADSTEHMPGLAGANFDMKDMQRCWMVKAIVGTVPRGSKLLEIGAGEPLVAGLLSRLGYDVTVVDPYDGSGNGPREFEQFKAAYPDVRFIREQFPPAEELGDDSAPSTRSRCSSTCRWRRWRRDGHRRPQGDRRRRRPLDPRGRPRARRLGMREPPRRAAQDRRLHGLPLADLDRTIDELRDDPEAYFVSAESHNRWRGGLPYDSDTMRASARSTSTPAPSQSGAGTRRSRR